MIGAGLHDGVPDGRGVVPGDVDLPAGVADVGDAEQVTVNTGNVHRQVGAVRRTFLAEVVVGELAEDRRCVGAPQAEGADLLRQVGEGDLSRRWACACGPRTRRAHRRRRR